MGSGKRLPGGPSFAPSLPFLVPQRKEKIDVLVRDALFGYFRVGST